MPLIDTGEMEHLYSRLSPEQRDELLECLFITATRGGKAMMQVLKQALLCHAVEGLAGQIEGPGCVRDVER